jgi:hypothetical protein
VQTDDDDCYFYSESLQHGGSSLQRGNSCSNSSSASLSSPALSTCANAQEASSFQQQEQQQAGNSSSGITGDAAWDSGPAGITFAEPVTTPTKDSQHGSISDLQPSLSRVESLSNSFIEEFESVDGGAGGAEWQSRQESEAGSIAGDFTPPRRSRADGSNSDAGGVPKQDRASDPTIDIINLSPPSPPPDCSADAGIDLSNIFELGLRASSRTSSVDVLQGSVRCYSEPDLSETLFGQQQQLDTGRNWASYSAGNPGCGSNASSRANSSLGFSAQGAPGALVLKHRQSAGASRLQSASQLDPEEDDLYLQPQQQQQAHEHEQQQVEVQQPKVPVQQEQPTVSIKQQQAQPAQVDDAVLVLSPTHKQEPDSCGLTFSPPKQDQQQQQQCPPGGSASDSGSSSSAASPVTPTAPGTTMALSNSDASATACADTDAAAAAAAATVAAAADAFELPCLDSAVELSATNVTASPDATAAAAADSCVSPVAPAGGFGFSFPTTPPSAVDAAVHEERAERVFSTWASNHSRSLSGALDLEFAAAGEDAEGGCC